MPLNKKIYLLEKNITVLKNLNNKITNENVILKEKIIKKEEEFNAEIN